MFQKIFFVLSALAAWSFDSAGVEGAAFFGFGVMCLPESPDVCIGQMSGTSPSPAVICNDPNDPNNCTSFYAGGWSWWFSFVEGLEEGEDDPDLILNATTGLEVGVRIDDNRTCEISVGMEDCKMCSTDGCTDSESIKYDCTNLENGKASLDECESLNPFLYPFLLEEVEESFTNFETDEETEGATESVIGPSLGAVDLPPGAVVVGECPETRPNDGDLCKPYIPTFLGAIGTMCLYDGVYQCECNLDIEDYWWCFNRPQLPHLIVNDSNMATDSALKSNTETANKPSEYTLVVGLCPEEPQSTGMPCREYIPTFVGATGTVCLYGERKQCECNLEIEEDWWCFERPDLPHLKDDAENPTVEETDIEMGADMDVGSSGATIVATGIVSSVWMLGIMAILM